MDADLDLLDRWRAGDRRAGEALFAGHFGSIYRFFEHKVGADADDLAQRTFLACVEDVDRFQRRSSFRTYLFAIARHELLDHLRRLATRGAIDFEVSSLAELVTSARGKLARAAEHDRLRAALAGLPVEQQLLLELHYWHELDAAQLADVLDASAGAIRVRLVRARQALRAALATVPADGRPIAAGDRLGQALGEPEAAGDDDDR